MIIWVPGIRVHRFNLYSERTEWYLPRYLSSRLKEEPGVLLPALSFTYVVELLSTECNLPIIAWANFYCVPTPNLIPSCTVQVIKLTLPVQLANPAFSHSRRHPLVPRHPEGQESR